MFQAISTSRLSKPSYHTLDLLYKSELGYFQDSFLNYYIKLQQLRSAFIEDVKKHIDRSFFDEEEYEEYQDNTPFLLDDTYDVE